MSNPSTILRSLTIYVICVPLAIFVGYLLSTPLTYSTITGVGFVVLILAVPLLLRWHHPLLFVSWNMALVLFFVKGQPNLWLAMVPLSLGISVMERALDRQRQFINVWPLALPLMFLVAIMLVTARLTGGLGLHTLGSSVYGGKKYILLLVSIMGYFALTARPIPVEKAKLYVGLFLLGGLTSMIGDLYPIFPPWAQFIFWFFSPNGELFSDDFVFGVTRLGGLGVAGSAVCYYMLARYGIRGIFLSGKISRTVVFLLILPVGLLGGFRSAVLTFILIFGVLFFLEGLHRTKYLVAFGAVTAIGFALLIPTASRLPFTFQRALAFLPLQLDPIAKASAEDSLRWRFDMWEAVLPRVPKHLLLGEGYSIAQTDYNTMMTRGTAFQAFDPSEQGLALAGDYHNGFLSIVLPFGIWGIIGFLWFELAALWALRANFRFGDQSLKTVNAFLYAEFAVLAVLFWIGGSLATNMAQLVGLLGVGVALNGGVARPIKESALAKTETPRLPRFQSRFSPSFQR